MEMGKIISLIVVIFIATLVHSSSRNRAEINNRFDSHAKNVGQPINGQCDHDVEFEFRMLTQDNLDNVWSFLEGLFPYKLDAKVHKALADGKYDTMLLYPKDSDQIVGVSTWFIYDGCWTCFTNTGFIFHFGIHPSFRKRGLGKYLMDVTLEELKNQGCQRAKLDVLAKDIDAINLYRKCGFEMKDINGIGFVASKELAPPRMNVGAKCLVM